MKTKEIVWRYILGQCRNCHVQSQFPVADSIGEDCNAWEELKQLRESGNFCSCGTKIRYVCGGDNW